MFVPEIRFFQKLAHLRHSANDCPSSELRRNFVPRSGSLIMGPGSFRGLIYIREKMKMKSFPHSLCGLIRTLCVDMGRYDSIETKKLLKLTLAVARL